MTDLTQIYAIIASHKGFTITDVSGNEKNFLVILENEDQIGTVSVHPDGTVTSYFRTKKAV